jgi:hypothetical protein
MKDMVKLLNEYGNSHRGMPHEDDKFDFDLDGENSCAECGRMYEDDDELGIDDEMGMDDERGMDDDPRGRDMGDDDMDYDPDAGMGDPDMDAGGEDMGMDDLGGDDDMGGDLGMGDDDVEGRLDDLEDKMTKVLSQFAQIIAQDMDDEDGMEPGMDDMEPGADDMEPGMDDMEPGADDMEPGADDMEPGMDDDAMRGDRDTDPGMGDDADLQAGMNRRSTDKEVLFDDDPDPTDDELDLELDLGTGDYPSHFDDDGEENMDTTPSMSDADFAAQRRRTDRLRDEIALRRELMGFGEGEKVGSFKEHMERAKAASIEEAEKD